MAFAKHLIPTVDVGVIRLTKPSPRLLLPAILLCLACGAVAFVFLFWRDGTHVNVMVNEQAALSPPRSAESVSSPTVEPVIGPKPASNASSNPTLNLASPVVPAGNSDKNDFTLSRSNKTTLLGPLEVRVTSIDQSKGLYDLDVKTGRRFSAHRRLRVNQPLWIVADRGRSSVKIIVASLDRDAVSGYWIPSTEVAHINSRAHGKHR